MQKCPWMKSSKSAIFPNAKHLQNANIDDNLITNQSLKVPNPSGRAPKQTTGTDVTKVIPS